MPLLAHAGHWLVNVAYFLPVVGFLAWLGWTELRNRRERRADGDRALPGTPRDDQG